MCRTPPFLLTMRRERAMKENMRKRSRRSRSRRMTLVGEILMICHLCHLIQLQVVPTRSVRSQLEECRDIDWPEDVFTCAEKEAAEANRIAAHYQSCQATSTDYSKHDVDKDRSWWAHIAQRMQENVHIWRLAVQARIYFL